MSPLHFENKNPNAGSLPSYLLIIDTPSVQNTSVIPMCLLLQGSKGWIRSELHSASRWDFLAAGDIMGGGCGPLSLVLHLGWLLRILCCKNHPFDILHQP